MPLPRELDLSNNPITTVQDNAFRRWAGQSLSCLSILSQQLICFQSAAAGQTPPQPLSHSYSGSEGLYRWELSCQTTQSFRLGQKTVRVFKKINRSLTNIYEMEMQSRAGFKGQLYFIRIMKVGSSSAQLRSVHFNYFSKSSELLIWSFHHHEVQFENKFRFSDEKLEITIIATKAIPPMTESYDRMTISDNDFYCNNISLPVKTGLMIWQGTIPVQVRLSWSGCLWTTTTSAQSLTSPSLPWPPSMVSTSNKTRGTVPVTLNPFWR